MNCQKRFFLPMFLLFIGCELVVDVDIPLEDRKLVLNSLFTPDSTWVAKLSLNRHILDEAPYQNVEDGDITLYDGENAVAKFSYDSMGFYSVKNFKPEGQKKYNIKVLSSQYGSVESFSYCPQPIHADTSDMHVTVDEFGTKQYAVVLTFDDPPGKNFYQVAGLVEVRFQNPQTGQGFINTRMIHIWSDDKGVDNENTGNAEGFYFDDGLFDGKRFSLNVKFTPNFSGGNYQTKYFLIFRHLSVDYYRYKTTSLLQNSTSGDPFAQPAKVYNNIKDGYGIFAGYSQQIIVYKP